MNYNVGDILLCRQGTLQENYISGKYYSISRMYTSDDLGFVVVVNSEKGTTEYKFIVNRDGIWGSTWNIHDYFYTINEMRKLKLEKLQCIK